MVIIFIFIIKVLIKLNFKLVLILFFLIWEFIIMNIVINRGNSEVLELKVLY